ncbi:MAG: hypothetical protein JWO86_8651 [Myxococcaceae bacterium]|nr:hypothetical protein [Myxococcaceae bacterium]
MEVVEADVVTGKQTPLVETAKRALAALNLAEVPYAVIGATALGVRGLPRFTADLDVVVYREDAFEALDALAGAGFTTDVDVDRDAEPEALYVLRKGKGTVDLLVASAEPESSVIAEATRTLVFGVDSPVASLEHLVLMYLYSNQPRHLGDLARIVVETNVDIAHVERYLADVHPEMLSVLSDRVHAARHPAPGPVRPARRKRT